MTNPWYEPLSNALEAARVEVVERMNAKGYPLSFTTQQLVILDNPESNGWHSEYQDVQRSGLVDERALLGIRDESASFYGAVLGNQLGGLAEGLKNTVLGAGTRFGFMPNATGAEAVLVRHLEPLAVWYLKKLKDLGERDDILVRRLADELQDVVTTESVNHVNQLKITGMCPAEALSHSHVALRCLNAVEQGAGIVQRMFADGFDHTLDSDIAAQPAQFFMPTAVLEVQGPGQIGDQEPGSTLLNRVVLASFLSGFDLGSAGTVAYFIRPRWMSNWTSYTPIPLVDKPHVRDQPITQYEFKALVDLAYKIPEFTDAEVSREEIVLNRVFLGCCASRPDAGFLDFATALEAALLGGENTELAYRFSLYGALFLADRREPDVTFEQLKTIYKVRSNLVHGTPVKSELRTEASKYAADLACAVARKAVESGWPSTKELDKRARSD